MPSPATLMSLLATSLIAYSDASPVVPRWKQPASESCGASAVGKALYLQTNEKCNNIVSIPIGLDGTLWGGSVISTGGSGGDQINAMTGMGDAPDALASQGAVYQVGDVSSSYPCLIVPQNNPLTRYSITVCFRRQRRLQHRLPVQDLKHKRHKPDPGRQTRPHPRRVPSNRRRLLKAQPHLRRIHRRKGRCRLCPFQFLGHWRVQGSRRLR